VTLSFVETCEGEMGVSRLSSSVFGPSDADCAIPPWRIGAI